MNFKSSHLYEQPKQFTIHLGKEQVLVISKPGLPDWDQVLPSTELLANVPGLHPSDCALLFGCHHGALAVALARRFYESQLSIMDNNYIALEMTRQTLSANHVTSAELLPCIDIPPLLYHKFNSVFIQCPKGRKLTRRWLVQAHLALENGGNLFIAGSNKSGIQSVIKDAIELFGDGRILAYKKGSRVFYIRKTNRDVTIPVWTQIAGIAPGTWVEFPVKLSDCSLHIRSLPGVFSFDHLDTGTDMLLNLINVPRGGHILDVGCGYGIIGLSVAQCGAGWVDLIDNDLLAIASCKETINLNRIMNASAYLGDLLDPIGATKYDLILSNPPFHAGQAVDYQIAIALLRQSFQALKIGGQILIVANRFLRYASLIEGIFGNLSHLAESGRFHVLSATKTD